MLRELFLGFIRIHILYHASLQPVYGLELIRELKSHGYHIGPGTMYPVLSKLEQSGFLVSKKITVAGKVRKYYEITAAGTEVLKKAQAKIQELASEVLDKN